MIRRWPEVLSPMLISRPSRPGDVEADIWAGKAEVDEECLVWEIGEAKERESMGFWKRAWEKMW
jgi:hypothetical protein